MVPGKATHAARIQTETDARLTLVTDDVRAARGVGAAAAAQGAAVLSLAGRGAAGARSLDRGLRHRPDVDAVGEVDGNRHRLFRKDQQLQKREHGPEHAKLAIFPTRDRSQGPAEQ